MVVVVVMCCPSFVVVVLVCCCVVLFVPFNPQFLFNVLLLVVVVVVIGVRGLLCVFVVFVFVCVVLLCVCSLPNSRVPLKVCLSSRSVFYWSLLFVVVAVVAGARCC